MFGLITLITCITLIKVIVNFANKLRLTRRAIKRMMLRISLGEHVKNVETKKGTRVDDVIARIARWTKRLVQWRVRLRK